MDEAFHFRLLRVSICQIIKASGYDKCSPSVLHAVTDIYIYHFNRLVQTCLKCAQHRTLSASTLQVQDIMLALLLTGDIKPEITFNQDVDPIYENTRAHPVSAYNTRSLDSFVDWMGYSDTYRVSQQLNELPQSLIKNLIEKRRLDLDDGSTDLERRKRKYQEKQQYYNSMLHRAGSVAENGGDFLGEPAPEQDRDEITLNDKLRWINYLIEKDLKLGQDMKFANTCLINEFLAFQKNAKFHPSMNPDNDDQNADPTAEFRYRVQHMNDNDYLVPTIEAVEKLEDATESNSLGTILKAAESETVSTQPVPPPYLIELLPYNFQYPVLLLNDDLDQYVEYRERQLPDGNEDMEIEEGDRAGDERESAGDKDSNHNGESSNAGDPVAIGKAIGGVVHDVDANVRAEVNADDEVHDGDDPEIENDHVEETTVDDEDLEVDGAESNV